MRIVAQMSVLLMILMSTAGCESMRRSSGRPNANVREPSAEQADPRPESERLRASARNAMHTSWISAVIAGGLWWAYVESEIDSGAHEDAYALGAAITGLASFVSLYISISKSIAAQEAAEQELAASIERFAREYEP